MNRFFLTLFLLLPTLSFGQINKSISIIDFVKINNDKISEARYYYENNWKVYRDIAIDKGYIKSYRLLTTTKDSSSNFDLIIITEYTDSIQFKASEANFQKIIKEVRPNGPKLLNDLKPNDFRKSLFLKQAETLFSSDVK